MFSNARLSQVHDQIEFSFVTGVDDGYAKSRSSRYAYRLQATVEINRRRSTRATRLVFEHAARGDFTFSLFVNRASSFFQFALPNCRIYCVERIVEYFQFDVLLSFIKDLRVLKVVAKKIDRDRTHYMDDTTNGVLIFAAFTPITVGNSIAVGVYFVGIRQVFMLFLKVANPSLSESTSFVDRSGVVRFESTEAVDDWGGAAISSEVCSNAMVKIVSAAAALVTASLCLPGS